MKSSSSVLAGFLLLSSVVAGCAVDATGTNDPGADDEAMASADESELRSGAQILAGAWAEGSGPVSAIVFTQESAGAGRYRFFADVDTGIRCIVAPCPSSARIEGSYKATTQKVTLTFASSSPYVKRLAGTHTYSATSRKLTLTKGTLQSKLKKADSYCQEASDCDEQDIIHIQCVGSFSCTSENTCRYSCGVRPPPQAGRCMSDNDCTGQNEQCSTSRGDCQSSGMLAVCSGVCEPKPAPVLERCGNVTCGAGTVCCNPLAGICTLPGQFCIQ